MKLTIYCDDEKDLPDQVAHVNIDGLQKVLQVVVEHLQTRVDEQRNDAETGIPAAICASCIHFKTECRGIQNGCEDWTPLP